MKDQEGELGQRKWKVGMPVNGRPGAGLPGAGNGCQAGGDAVAGWRPVAPAAGQQRLVAEIVPAFRRPLC